jgi:hypothetical protein
MQRIVLIYGLVAGLVTIGSAIWGTELVDPSGESLAVLEYLGYLIMLIALSVIFVGIKRYRDQELGGVVTFSAAVLVGLGISVVASIVYVAAWEIYLFMTDHAFINNYADSVMTRLRTAGASSAELAAKARELEAMRMQYGKPLFRIGITFLEIFPVGLLITLISAAVLRKSSVLPATP